MIVIVVVFDVKPIEVTCQERAALFIWEEAKGMEEGRWNNGRGRRVMIDEWRSDRMLSVNVRIGFRGQYKELRRIDNRRRRWDCM